MSSTLFGMPDHFDVIVIGAGPAGSTTAAMLAKRGRRVLLMDRERFPRYHIGESLIPVFMPAMYEIGVPEIMDARGYERKYGGSLIWGNRQIPWNFSFMKGGEHAYAFHARRADLDTIILDQARNFGAYVLEETTVKEPVLSDTGRVTGVRFTVRGMPTVYEATADLVVDASGQSRLLSRRFSDVEWHNELRNVAVWTYYDNCHRLPGDEASNILIEGLEDGWFWAIPIARTTMSVGYVTSSQAAGEVALPEIFTIERDKTSRLRDLLRDAHQCAGFRTARDWSYTNKRFVGDGWVLVGDAAAFVDPLFSTGVALATLAATALSRIIDRILDVPAIEQRALQRYASAYREFFNEIRSFVERFYDRTKYKEYYYDLAQEIVDPERLTEPSHDFVTLISGMSGRHPLLNINVDDLTEEVPVGA